MAHARDTQNLLAFRSEVSIVFFIYRSKASFGFLTFAGLDGSLEPTLGSFYLHTCSTSNAGYGCQGRESGSQASALIETFICPVMENEKSWLGIIPIGREDGMSGVQVMLLYLVRMGLGGGSKLCD